MTRPFTILLSIVWSWAFSAPDTLLLSQLDDTQKVSKFATYAVYPAAHGYEGLQFFPKAIDRAPHQQAVFIRLVVKNDLSSPQRFFLRLPLNEYWEMLEGPPGSKKSLTGYLQDQSRLDVPEEKQFFDVLLAPGQTTILTLKTYNASTRYVEAGLVYALSEKAFYRSEYHSFYENIWGLGISIFFQGAIAIMMLYMFFVYFQNNRDKTYLFYGLYMFFAMYYLLQKIAGDGPFFFLFPDNSILRHLLNEPVQWLIYIFYNLFVVSFLEIKKRSKRLYRIFTVLNILYAVYLLAELAFMLLTFDKVAQGNLYVVSRIVVIAISVYIIVDVAVSIKSPLVAYIISGSTLFMLFTVTAMLYSLRLSWLPGTNLYPINFMQIGIMLEILFFSLGLGRRIHLGALERHRLQKAYIDQLVRNEEIMQKSNTELSQQVYARTSEIMNKTRELEREREKKITAQYEKQLAESEMNALKLQMNPHFIFNSLNAIRNYVLKEESEKASDYITSFSRLLRLILQHSKQNAVKLSEELEALGLYLQFEQQRFENKFEFSIDVSGKVNPDEVLIQPMVIQPFVENSIWHGLMPKSEKGHLQLMLQMLNKDTLKVVIEDNGIGRDEANKLKEQQESNTYKSMGLQITRDRLRLMEKLQHGDTGYEIEDLVDKQGNPIGTRVTIKIKLK